MPNYYEEFLRDKLAKERSAAEAEEFRKSFDRTCEFEKKTKEEYQRRIQILAQQQKNEINMMGKKTDEKLDDIGKKMKTEMANYEKLESEMKEKAEREFNERKKRHDDIITENKTILKMEQLEIENELLETESELRKTKEKVETTIELEEERNEARRENLLKEQKERDNERLKEILEKQDEKKEIEIKILRDVAVKRDELHDKQNQDIVELENSFLKDQMGEFKTYQIKYHQTNNKRMNECVSEIQSLSDKIELSYNQCLRYLSDGFEWDEGTKKRAKDSFDRLNATIHKSRKALTETERKLTEIENDEVAKKMSETIKKMRIKLNELGRCTANFSGKLLSKQTNWKQEDKDELKKFIEELSVISEEFPKFDQKKAELLSHLKEQMPDISNSSEQKKIQQ